MSKEFIPSYSLSGYTDDAVLEDDESPPSERTIEAIIRGLTLTKLEFYSKNKTKITFRLIERPEYFYTGTIKEIKDSQGIIFEIESGELMLFSIDDISHTSIHPSIIEPIKYFNRESISQQTRQEIFNRCNKQCELKLVGCTNNADTIDHWIPVTRGGSNDLDNLRGSCLHCNQVKSTRLWEEIPKESKL